MTGHISTLVHHLKLVLDGSDFPLIFLIDEIETDQIFDCKDGGDVIFDHEYEFIF